MRKNEWKALTILIGGIFLVYLLFYGGPHDPDRIFLNFSFSQGYLMAGTMFVMILMEIFAPSDYVGSYLAPRHLFNSIKRGVIGALVYYAASMIFWCFFLWL